MSVDAAAVKAAVKARRAYIINNLNTMTLKSCRQMLEEDLSLESGALKPFKDLLSAMIDKIIAKGKADQEVQNGQGSGSSGKKQQKQKAKAAASDNDGRSQPSKRQKREDKQPAKQSGPRQYSRSVEKLRGICKVATITIPPSLYVKNKSDEDLQAALNSLLEKHGLDIKSGEREIQKARSKLQVQRDLEGIDTSNIIQGGRSRRAAAHVSYKALVQPSESEEEDEEESGGEDEVAVLSGSEAEAASQDEEPAKATKPAARKQQAMASKAAATSESEPESDDVASSSREAAEDDLEEEQEEEAQEEAPGAHSSGKAAAPSPPQRSKPAAPKSPDENLAVKSNTGAASGRKRSKSTSKAQAAFSLEDSDEEQAAAAPAGRRRALAEWSDEED